MGDASFRVPGYLVDAPLGRGASGGVWLGRVASSLDPVALKRIALGSAAQVIAARAEAALLAELDHPNLVRLHELIIDGTDAVLVLDLAAGGSLADLIAARGSLTAGEVVTALAPIAAALAYLHDAGVVHGDVTPGNILFTENGQPMLADLGVARLIGDRTTVRSTPAYIDPGVAAGFMPAPQSDVFMLGGVAIHCLTGRALWPGDTAEDALFAALAANLSGLDARFESANVPGEMRAVLHRALAVEPARRGTAADFALDLRYSTKPTAVELAAGRARTTPLATTAIPPAAAPAPAPVPAQAPAAAVVPVPKLPAPVERSLVDTDEFERVPAVALDDPAEQIHDGDPAQTHIAQPRPRPSRTHRHRPSRWRAGWLRWAVAGGCVAALAAGGVAWGVIGSGNRHAATSRSTTPGTSDVAPAPGIDGSVESLSVAQPDTGTLTGSPHSVTGSSAPLSATDVQNVLVGLDALRERAFARRAPLLLTGVYVPGPLLDEDTASLERIVPSGCGLEGVQTTYSNVVITSQQATEVTISVRAKLAESVLFCNGTAKAKAAGSGPSTLHMTLLRSGVGFLIKAVTT